MAPRASASRSGESTSTERTSMAPDISQISMAPMTLLPFITG